MTARYLTTARLRELDTQLSDRDGAVLRRVAELRFVTGSQLTRLHFAEGDDPTANARAARRALLRLTRLGVLVRLPRRVGGVRAGSAGFVYCLGSAGHALAIQRGWQPEGRRRRSQVPGTLFLSHTLQVAELCTLLVEADRAQAIELLALRAEPACWRRYGSGGTQATTLKPDSYVRFNQGEYEFVFFIEVDRDTEGSRAIDTKLKQYLAYEATGQEQREHGVFPLTLWLVPDAMRAQAIEDCAQRLPSAGRELFRVAEFREAMSVLVGDAAVTGPEPAGKRLDRG